MGSEKATSTDPSSGTTDHVLECWSQEPSLGEDGAVIYHTLSATVLLKSDSSGLQKSRGAEVEKSAAEAYFSALGFLITLFRAERGFLFGTDSTVDGPGPEIGPPLASRNLDGETVNQPGRKIPVELFHQVSETGEPVLCGASDPEGAPGPKHDSVGKPSHAAVLPVNAVGKLQAILYIENRFQPLHLNRETLRLARGYCHVLGSLVELQKVRSENDSLWVDLSRLRETVPTTARITTPAVPRGPSRRTKRIDLKGDYSGITGSSKSMLDIFGILDRISTSSAPVLINGESGTGKELIANAVHQNSPRKGQVFVSENCGALTETLLESELFGYVKGAFTGANKDHKGLFELAVGGTLFLDEVGDMSPSMQKKLLRVLQEGVIRRVGGKDYISVDVRTISATNKDLLEEVRSGNFREDLYYRLNVINLKLPPLRERKEDIPELVETFLAGLTSETGLEKKIEPAAVQRLIQYRWPGNIRELLNEMKRLHTLSDGDIRVADISETVLVGETRDLPFQELERELSHLSLKDATERLEKEMIRNALVQCRGNKSLMAKMLQVPKTSLYNKINRYGLEKV